MIRISVIDGAPAQSFSFEEDMVSVGRSRRNTLVLDDRTLSRVHCEIASVNGRYLLVNHAKTNGTCVNGQPVGEAFLKPGDTLLVGRVALRFEGGDGAAPAAEGKRSGRRRIFGRIPPKMDPVAYAVAYVVGLALSPVLFWVLR